MSVRIEATYLGDLGCTVRHAPSADRIFTDAPVDNHGRGLHFSPTDLLATALGTCILTTMAIAAKARGIDFADAAATVEKEMGAFPRRHVSRLTVKVRMPRGLDPLAREVLEKTAAACPVAASLAPATEVMLSFEYPVTFFDEVYEGQPPWDVGHPQSAIVAIGDQVRGAVLDAGCGTGEHALFFASRGATVTGMDFAPRAIEIARAKASERGLPVTFKVGDALAMEGLGRSFDHIIDSGLFHVFDDEERGRYVEQLSQVLKPGGVLHLLCFSEHTPGDQGPRRVTREEIRKAFAEGWKVEAIDEAEFESRRFEPMPRAWRARIVRG